MVGKGSSYETNESRPVRVGVVTEVVLDSVEKKSNSEKTSSEKASSEKTNNGKIRVLR